MSNASGFRRLLRHLPGEGGSAKSDELHDAYKAGKVTIRWSAERGLEHIGHEADLISERYRLRRLRGR